MPAQPSRKISVSLPVDIVHKLDFISMKLRCSRSGLLSQILLQSVDPLVAIAQCLPDPGVELTEVDARRLRGSSARIIGEQVATLLSGAQDDLFRE